MQSSQNKKQLFIFTLIYSIIVMFALLLPFYLYVQESRTNLRNQELEKINKEVIDIKLKVCITNDIDIALNSSMNYKIVFLNKKGSVIASNDKNYIFMNYERQSGFDGDKVYAQTSLEEERNGAVKIIAVRSLDYSELVVKVFFLAIYMLLFLIVSSGLLIYYSTKSLASTNKYLEQFFNDAMHEIRTPLGIIQMNLDMLSQTIMKSNERILNRTQAATKSLTSIYEDIEYFIKQRKVDFQKESINLSAFVIDRLEFINVLAKVKNIEIKSDIEHEIGYNFNRIELQRLIDNNMSNAIKYSNANTTIHVVLKKEGDKILLIFQDEGRGIEDISKIFTRYYRGDEIKGGFGMGLSIVRKVCLKYDIEIEVESKAGEGSKFTYSLNNS